MRFLVILRLGSKKAQDKLTPLLNSPLVDHLDLVRHAPVALESEKLTQFIHWAGLDDSGGKANWRASLRNTWLCFYNGLRLTLRQKPDALISFQLLPYGALTWLVAKLTRRPVILSLTGDDFNFWVKKRGIGSILKTILRHSDAVTIFGEKGRNELITLGVAPERAFTLLNPIDTTAFVPDPTVTKEYDLIFIGYLRPPKRVDLLLQALAGVHKIRPETNLVIVGDGDEQANLSALAAHLNLSDHVTFAGWHDQVLPYLQKSRILVLLSEREGLPVVALEAMSVGLPVILTDVGSIHTIVRNGENGYLVDSPADPALVARLILHILADPAQYSKFSAEAMKIHDTHDVKQVTRNWERIIRSTLPDAGEGLPDNHVSTGF